MKEDFSLNNWSNESQRLKANVGQEERQGNGKSCSAPQLGTANDGSHFILVFKVVIAIILITF